MKYLSGFCLTFACGALAAQVLPSKLMPDGSRDAYVGLGLSVRSVYEGASDMRTQATPALQMEWSNGVFLAGTSLGWHWSEQPQLEYGPLITWQPARTEAGVGSVLSPVESSSTVGIATTPPGMVIPGSVPPLPAGRTRLSGMDTLPAHLERGGFVNLYLSPRWRVTTTLFNGGGGRDAAWRASADLQQVLRPLSPQHAISVGVGLTWANAAYHQAHFGVTEQEARRSYNAPYAPGDGTKDLHLDGQWRWALQPSWLLVSSVRWTHLLGPAAASPLVERAQHVALSSVLAYRF